MNLKQNKAYASKFRNNYCQELKLAVQIVEDKVKGNEAITDEEIQEVVEIMQSNLTKIKDLNPEKEGY